MRNWRTDWKERAAVLVPGAVASGLVACSSGASGSPQATPSSLVFPQTVVGQQATQDVTIKNAAESGALTIESTGIAGPDAGMFADGFDDATSVALAPGQSTTITVVFSPTAAGSRSATLRVNHSGSGDLGVPLSGTAVTADPGARPLVASPASPASPASLSFPATTVGQSATLDVTLQNGAASDPLQVSSVGVSGPDSAMFATDFGGSVTLQPGASVTVRVAFRVGLGHGPDGHQVAVDAGDLGVGGCQPGVVAEGLELGQGAFDGLGRGPRPVRPVQGAGEPQEGVGHHRRVAGGLGGGDPPPSVGGGVGEAVDRVEGVRQLAAGEGHRAVGQGGRLGEEQFQVVDGLGVRAEADRLLGGDRGVVDQRPRVARLLGVHGCYRGSPTRGRPAVGCSAVPSTFSAELEKVAAQRRSQDRRRAGGRCGSRPGCATASWGRC